MAKQQAHLLVTLSCLILFSTAIPDASTPDAGKTYYYLGLAYLSQGDKPHAYLNLNKYKAKYYQILSKEEQDELDRLIALARD